jgi:hypothetical protein
MPREIDPASRTWKQLTAESDGRTGLASDIPAALDILCQFLSPVLFTKKRISLLLNVPTYNPAAYVHLFSSLLSAYLVFSTPSQNANNGRRAF